MWGRVYIGLVPIAFLLCWALDRESISSLVCDVYIRAEVYATLPYLIYALVALTGILFFVGLSRKKIATFFIWILYIIKKPKDPLVKTSLVEQFNPNFP